MNKQPTSVKGVQSVEKVTMGTIGAKVPVGWLTEIDAMVKERGLPNRSEFLRKVLEPIVVNHRKMAERRVNQALTAIRVQRPETCSGYVIKRVNDGDNRVKKEDGSGP